MGGPPFSLAAAGSNSGKGKYGSVDPDSFRSSPNRRSVYAFIDRSALPEMFNTFDFANPDMSTGERIMTTVPQQALFMMNSPFLVEQVKNILARPDITAAATDAEKVRLIFRTLFQRAPRPQELKLAEQFLASESPEPATIGQTDSGNAKYSKKASSYAQMKPLDQWERYTQVVLLTNELIFVN
jgi:hypothetical protein